MFYRLNWNCFFFGFAVLGWWTSWALHLDFAILRRKHAEGKRDCSHFNCSLSSVTFFPCTGGHYILVQAIIQASLLLTSMCWNWEDIAWRGSGVSPPSRFSHEACTMCFQPCQGSQQRCNKCALKHWFWQTKLCITWCHLTSSHFHMAATSKFVHCIFITYKCSSWHKRCFSATQNTSAVVARLFIIRNSVKIWMWGMRSCRERQVFLKLVSGAYDQGLTINHGT